MIGAGHMWQMWIDTGGTFTDCLAIDPSGRVHRAKVLSTSSMRGRLLRKESERVWRVEGSIAGPGFHTGAGLHVLPGGEPFRAVVAHPEPDVIELEAPLPGELAGSVFELRFRDEAPILAARMVTGAASGASLPPIAMRLATTRGTNALLERSGGRTALFITRGLADLLEIGTQQRPDLFALDIRKPSPLYEQVCEVEERLAADGAVVRELNLNDVRTGAREAYERGIRCAAVALMHAYRSPEHEQRVRDVLFEEGFDYVSCSSALAPLIKILPRAETAVVDAYLSPVIAGYVSEVEARLAEAGTLHVMTSAGGMVRAKAFRPKDSLLSGPAGGVVGARASGVSAGFPRIISFDMGGTSTDVARVDDKVEYAFEHRVGDATVMAPAVAVESVAAGGGSICSFDGYRLHVGPRSAGAFPGPACYGAGGPLTITDVQLLLGRLVPSHFGIPLDVAASRAAFDSLLQSIREASQHVDEPSAILFGLLQVAVERMADAIRRISLRRGYDPADHALVAFGGAGGQCACRVAELLGMRTVIIPVEAGLLSALGLGFARMERFSQRHISEPLDDIAERLDAWRDELARCAREELAADGADPRGRTTERAIAYLRFTGQETLIPVELEGGDSLAAEFNRRYQELYGYRPESGTIEVESIRVVVSVGGDPRVDLLRGRADRRPVLQGRQEMCVGERFANVPVLDRAELETGARIEGPAIIAERHGTTVIEPSWSVDVHVTGALIVVRESA